MNQEKGLISNIQSFSIHDGPGTRTVIFFKGCNLHCWWCHNPESQSPRQEIMFHASRCIGCGACAQVCPCLQNGHAALFTPQCRQCGRCALECYADALRYVGEWWDSTALTERLLMDADGMLQSGGGVTFSGGEPLLQSDFLIKVLKNLKQAGIHTAVESALHASWEKIEPILPYVDLLFCDIKTMDSRAHRLGTGVGNELILENILRVSHMGKNMCIRTPIIPGYNDDEDNIGRIARFVAGLPSHPAYELLAFHNLCAGKYTALNRFFAGADLREPDAGRMQTLAELCGHFGINPTIRI